MQSRPSGLVFGAVLGCILVFGLWPFGRPLNEIGWVVGKDSKDGIRLGKHATVLSTRPLPSTEAGSCHIEMWVRPSSVKGTGTLLGFYGEHDAFGLSLHQWRTGLEIFREPGGTWRTAIYTNDVFDADKAVRIGITAGSSVTSVYVNGSQVPGSRNYGWAQQPCNGSFVVGDSPSDNDSWQGELFGLSISRGPGKAGRTASLPDVLYLFDEHSGRIIRDRGSAGDDLSIPERYVVARKTLLESPVAAFHLTWGYVQDLLINIGGFVPFGWSLSALLLSCRRKRYVTTATVTAGFATSLMIETLQAYLPTRDSDLTDVITNTFGTWLGVWLLRSRSLRELRECAFRWISEFASLLAAAK